MLSFCHALKQHTLLAHQHAESNPVMQGLLQPDVTRALYHHFLSQMLCFYTALEDRIAAQRPALPTGYHHKVPLLQHDLQAYANDALTPCDRHRITLPATDSPAAWVGMLYVTEGSTLGGAVIAKHLSQHLAAPVSTQFLLPYRAHTRQQWENTCHFINTTALMPSFDASAALASAVRTFDAIGECLHAA